MNEVIRAVLNPLFFILTKRLCTHQKQQKHQKQISTKTQPRKNTKTEISKKYKNCLLKTSKGKKVTYLLICFFLLFVRAKIEKREKSPQC